MAKPDLVIEGTVFYQLLGDPAFYAALPPQLDSLRGVGAAAYAQAFAVATGRACSGCTVHGALRDALAAYGVALAAVHAENPDALGPLAAYVAGKRGYRPGNIVVYYRGAGGRTLTLKF